jgi:hypothetical protein
MKKLIIIITILTISISLSAQMIFDLGIKAGFTNSKVYANIHEFNSESILRYHIGAFGRVGFNRVYLQPEAYYSAKGGELEGSILDVTSRFDFNSLDIPLLLGIKIIDGEKGNLRLMAGPVFSILTSSDIEGDDILDTDYYKNHYYGFQYGIGADIFGITLDARVENASDKFYQNSDQGFNVKNNTFMISVGFKIF